MSRLREAIESFRSMDEGFNTEHPVYKQTYSAYRAVGEPHEHAHAAARNAMAHGRPVAQFKQPPKKPKSAMGEAVLGHSVAELERAHQHAHGELVKANRAGDYKRRDQVHQGLMAVSHKLERAHQDAGIKKKFPYYHHEFNRHARPA